MIYLFHGENEFQKRERLQELEKQASSKFRVVDGETMSSNDLREVLFNQTLFDEVQLVAVRDLGSSEAWVDLPAIIGDREVELTLLEPKVDKRTKTYKWLQKKGKVEEFAAWGDRDRDKAINWCVSRSKDYSFDLDRLLASDLVDRLGFDQLRLDEVLKQLSLAEEIDQDLINKMIPLPKTESVFDLLKSALDGNVSKIKQIIEYLEMVDGDEGAYRTMGLLVSQLVILNGLVSGGKPEDLLKDLSINPYAVRPWRGYVAKITVKQMSQINHILGRADISLKTTGVSPWLIIEAALVEISNTGIDKLESA